MQWQYVACGAMRVLCLYIEVSLVVSCATAVRILEQWLSSCLASSVLCVLEILFLNAAAVSWVLC